MLRLLAVIFLISLNSCVNESGARMGLFSATSPVAATIKGDVFIGWAVGDASGRGTISVQSAVNPKISCVGEFRYVSMFARSGVGSLTCNDGGQATFNFQGMTNLKGYGYGNSNKGPVSFTYGMTAKESSKYLQKPFLEIDNALKKQIERDKEKKNASNKTNI